MHSPSDQLKNHYSKLSDDKIQQLAIDYKSLTEEAQAILFEEVKKRNFEPELWEWLTLDRLPFSPAEIDIILHQNSYSKCSNCEEKQALYLWKIHFSSTKKFYRYFFFYGCKNCAQQQLKRNFITTLLFGWRGWLTFFYTPSILIKIVREYIHPSPQRENELRNIIHQNTGLFREMQVKGTDPVLLWQFINAKLSVRKNEY